MLTIAATTKSCKRLMAVLEQNAILINQNINFNKFDIHLSSSFTLDRKRMVLITLRMNLGLCPFSYFGVQYPISAAILGSKTSF